VGRKYQSDISHTLSGNTIGLGGALNVTENIQVNAGIGYTKYIQNENWYGRYSPIGKYFMVNEIYNRDNLFIGIGVDLSL